MSYCIMQLIYSVVLSFRFSSVNMLVHALGSTFTYVSVGLNEFKRNEALASFFRNRPTEINPFNSTALYIGKIYRRCRSRWAGSNRAGSSGSAMLSVICEEY